MSMKKMAAIMLSAVFAVSVMACGSSSSGTEAAKEAEASASGSAVETIKQNGKVIMMTNAEFEPFEFKDGDAFAGIDIEISQKIADELGVELEISDIAPE